METPLFKHIKFVLCQFIPSKEAYFYFQICLFQDKKMLLNFFNCGALTTFAREFRKHIKSYI
jgi:hypothetical protein